MLSKVANWFVFTGKKNQSDKLFLISLQVWPIKNNIYPLCYHVNKSSMKSSIREKSISVKMLFWYLENKLWINKLIGITYPLNSKLGKYFFTALTSAPRKDWDEIMLKISKNQKYHLQEAFVTLCFQTHHCRLVQSQAGPKMDENQN